MATTARPATPRHTSRGRALVGPARRRRASPTAATANTPRAPAPAPRWKHRRAWAASGARRAQIQAPRHARHRQCRRVPARVRRVRAQFRRPDPEKRLPNFMVMSLPENHTAGTTPGRIHAHRHGREQRLCRGHDRGPPHAQPLLAGDRRSSLSRTTRRTARTTSTRAAPPAS